ncbi:MAG: glycosyltransferase, partial [Thermoprotei archaeon]
LYDPTRYRGSISGILLEAFSFGKPVVVREGSWLANQIKKFGGGVIVKDTSPESLKIAVEEIRFNYEKYSLEAFKAGEVLYKKYNGVELAKLIKKEVDNRELK